MIHSQLRVLLYRVHVAPFPIRLSPPHFSPDLSPFLLSLAGGFFRSCDSRQCRSTKKRARQRERGRRGVFSVAISGAAVFSTASGAAAPNEDLHVRGARRRVPPAAAVVGVVFLRGDEGSSPRIS